MPAQRTRRQILPDPAGKPCPFPDATALSRVGTTRLTSRYNLELFMMNTHRNATESGLASEPKVRCLTQASLCRAIIAGSVFLILALKVTSWSYGRSRILSDVDLPGHGQTACCSLVLHSDDVALWHFIHQSLHDHTDIQTRLGGVMEAKAYSAAFCPAAVIKISAPAASLGEVAVAARRHLALAFPTVRPEFRLGFLSP